MATLRPHEPPAVPQAGNQAHTTTHTRTHTTGPRITHFPALHARLAGTLPRQAPRVPGARVPAKECHGVRVGSPARRLPLPSRQLSHISVPAASRFRLSARPSAPPCSPYHRGTRHCGHTSSLPRMALGAHWPPDRQLSRAVTDHSHPVMGPQARHSAPQCPNKCHRTRHPLRACHRDGTRRRRAAAAPAKLWTRRAT